MINTVIQLRDACQLLNTIDMQPRLHALLSAWVLRNPFYGRNHIRHLHQMKDHSVALISNMWSGKQISYFSTMFIGRVRLTTAAFAHGKRINDSSILVKINGINTFAIVKEIFLVEEQMSFLQVCCLMDNRSFVCATESNRFTFNDIQEGSMGSNCIVPSTNFVEKCVRIEYPSNSSLTFIRFPNLSESS